MDLSNPVVKSVARYALLVVPRVVLSVALTGLSAVVAGPGATVTLLVGGLTLCVAVSAALAVGGVLGERTADLDTVAQVAVVLGVGYAVVTAGGPVAWVVFAVLAALTGFALLWAVALYGEMFVAP